ncbi:MAG: class I SAM-dependent methyltransferase [Burkholderiales bacterium]|nr:class I SAM-dependent methyltransferase [Burkholderiales bacterium]
MSRTRTLARDPLSPGLQAGMVQAGASVIALVPVLAGLDVSLAQWALVQGAIAMRIATLCGAPAWWPPLHLGFTPALVWAQGLAVAPLAWGAAFLALVAVYGSTLRTQVPLFLTARAVREALGVLLAPERGVRFIDLGCGLGTVIAALKRARPDCEFHGVELAPLPFLVSRWRGARAGCRIQRRDLMSIDLGQYDVVYAFLSPAPMPALWAKARREMRRGSLFVSLAFAVPGVEPHETIRVAPGERHTLYLWRM